MVDGFHMEQSKSEDINNNEDHGSALLILRYYVIRGRSSGGKRTIETRVTNRA